MATAQRPDEPKRLYDPADIKAACHAEDESATARLRDAFSARVGENRRGRAEITEADVLESRVIRANSNLCFGLNAELTLYVEGSAQPTLDVIGAVFDRPAIRGDDGFSFDVPDATTLRALGELLIVMAERGEAAGMFQRADLEVLSAAGAA